MELKGERFAVESFKYKCSSQYGTTTFAQDVPVSRPYFIILYYSTLTSLPWQFFPWSRRDGVEGGG